jgi:hypothetical protein
VGMRHLKPNEELWAASCGDDFALTHLEPESEEES